MKTKNLNPSNGKKNEQNNKNQKINIEEESSDIYPHLKNNILYSNKNCKHAISDESYYCLNCKIRVCPECNLKQHQEHELIKEKDYLFYNPNFFSEIEKVINDSYKIEENRNDYINTVENCFNSIQKKLDEIKEKKINEINELFNQTKKNISDLQNNLNNISKEVKDYYSRNSHFFNLSSTHNVNNDNENNIFLINYELLHLCDKKNKEIIKSLNILKENFLKYKNEINSQTDLIKNNIEDFINKKIPNDKFDDFYWDVKLRIKSYNDHIDLLQKTIFNILKKTGSYDDLQEVVNILDSKNKKGIDYIFNQNFFTQNNSLKKKISNSSSSTNIYKSSSKDKDKEKDNDKDNLSTNLSNKNLNDKTKLNKSLKRYNSSNLKKLHRGNSSSKISSKLSSNSNFYITSESNIRVSNYLHQKSINTLRKSVFDKSIKTILSNLQIHDYKDIILDNDCKRKFFNYSMIDLYSKLFSSKPRKSFDTNSRVFADYNMRYNKLKEFVKPIKGTNEIIIYDPQLNTSNKYKINLDKETIGYDKFPDGNRHICINNKLYITGGVDSLGTSISISLLYDVDKGTIKRINNMIVPHSYHSIEYLENYDCFIIVGGKDNNVCEIFDLFTNKWNKLPDLCSPRANTNLYFDSFSSDVYAMFGMEGPITNLINNNCEIIEVLELNDINSGWIKIDYYKSSNVDLKQTLVSVVPFTRDKLLIFGGKKSRVNKHLYALFLMNKNELIKADEKILEEIKREEKKIKFISSSVNKVMK